MNFVFICLISLVAHSSSAKTIVTTVYNRQADITILEKLVQIKDLRQLVRLMEKENVKIFKVTPKELANTESTFSFLAEASVTQHPELQAKIIEVDSGSALFSTQDELPSATSNIILIASDAEPMTLIHEFVHHLFELQNHADTEKITASQIEAESILRRFNFKTRKVMMNYSLLISKQWRDEIKSVIEDYTSTVDSSQGHVSAEEVAIETALVQLLIQQKSVHLNLDRAANGINNYALGLTGRSESLVQNIFALNDLLVTDGMNQDPETTDAEREDWKLRRTRVEIKLNAYLNGPLASMRKQIQSAQELLK